MADFRKVVRDYYSDPERAIAYFHRIRARRGVLPIWAEWVKRFPAGAEIFDIGFGPGIEFEFLLDRGFRVSGLDISAPMKQELEKVLDVRLGPEWRLRGRLQVSSMEDVPVSGPRYDRIYGLASFLHIEQKLLPALLSQWGQVLRPQGEFFLSLKEGEGATGLDDEGRPLSLYTERSFLGEVVPSLHGLRLLSLSTQGGDSLGRSVRWLTIVLGAF